ncbi:ATP-dependent RecD-like DNA helicase [Geobacillus thermodenitrificans]|uniref:SF1B family DNA helicase RecD2 n=1 Tax=Geobacillus thermodenitrificans TaxID=33940 RepID=UPI003D1FE4FF
MELKVQVDRKIYYNEDSSFGVFAVKPLTNKDQVQLNRYNNITIRGTMPELFVGKEYNVIVTESNHPKYGHGYDVILVKFNKPTTVEEQQVYIRTILHPRYAEAIIAKYPNHKIIDMIQNDTFDYTGIKGIKKARFEKIKRDLLSNLEIQDILIDLKDLKLTPKAARKILDHFGSAILAVKKIRENIYCLTDIHGFGFKTVDEFALNRGDSKYNKNRIIAGIKYLLIQEEQNGHSWISLETVLKEGEKLLEIDKKYIHDTINELKNNNQNELYINDHQIALYRNYYYEKRIKEMLFDLLRAESTIRIKDIDKKIAEIEQEYGVTYTHEQKNAIHLACENNVFILNGRGGTGKTFTLKAILKILEDYEHICCALSGKASKIMSSHGLNAMTIHRALEYDGKNFTYNEKNKIPYPIIVVDEAGMNSNYIMYCLISAIREGSKLIIVGDSGQLSPIGAGNVFDDLIKSKTLPMQELTIVQRQAQKSGILLCANQIRDGKQILGSDEFGKHVFGELKDFVVLSERNKENIINKVLLISKKYKNRVQDFQVICGVKERGELSVKKLNIKLQQIFNPEEEPFIERHGYCYKVGDKIIQNGNNYYDEVFNGTLGYIIDVRPELNEIYIQFEDKDELVCYKGDDIDQIELAYAITCHRSQGSTIPIVLFVFDYSSYTLLSKQFVYTGITRASKGCIMLCEHRALRYAIGTDHSGKRNTFLKEMLMESR